MEIQGEVAGVGGQHRAGREGCWFGKISAFLAGYQLRIREPVSQGSGESLKGTGDLGIETCSGALIAPQISRTV